MTDKSETDTNASLLARADAIAAMTPKGVVQTDSTLLIREDRWGSLVTPLAAKEGSKGMTDEEIIGLAIGTWLEKNTGDYTTKCDLRQLVRTRAGKLRAVCEFAEPQGVLHIFSPSQLHISEAPAVAINVDAVIDDDLTVRAAWFQQESNRIEGINEVRPGELQALLTFLRNDALTIDALKAYVASCQPDARLRDHESIPGVRVGNHVALASGWQIVEELGYILIRAERPKVDVWRLHCEYEDLYPFTDCNGRSGRALWLWMMLRGEEWQRRQALDLGFLHTFYYQTLARQK